MDKPDSVNYWLSLWNSTYRYLLELAPTNCVFSCYEELCEEPNRSLGNLFETAETPREVGMGDLGLRLPKTRQIPPVDESLWTEGQLIYDELISRTY